MVNHAGRTAAFCEAAIYEWRRVAPTTLELCYREPYGNAFVRMAVVRHNNSGPGPFHAYWHMQANVPTTWRSQRLETEHEAMNAAVAELELYHQAMADKLRTGTIPVVDWPPTVTK